MLDNQRPLALARFRVRLVQYSRYLDNSTDMAAPEWVQLQSSITPKSKEDSTSKRIRDLKRRHREAIRFAYQKGFLRRLDHDLLYEHIFGRKVPKDEDSEENEDVLAPELNMGELMWLNVGGKHIRTIDETIIFSCDKLKICILSSNYISDITPFHSCINLVKLDLRDNQVLICTELNSN